MSGSAGGNRIKRENIEITVKKYKEEVLSKCKIYKSHLITGSYNGTDRNDFGDIDMVIHFRGRTKLASKESFVTMIKTLPDNVIVPFKSTRYKGRKYLNTGEIITILYPVVGTDEYVQIDNIFALSESEKQFKNIFLNYPAPVQGLILGLVKTVLLEHDQQDIFERVVSSLGWINFLTLNDNQEYEFNLSSSGLSLRIVTLEGFKTIEKFEVYKYTDWSLVETILHNYDLNVSFDNLLEQIDKKLKNPRSKKRVKGIFKSMVSVKSGEVNTPKGDEKLRTLERVETL